MVQGSGIMRFRVNGDYRGLGLRGSVRSGF